MVTTRAQEASTSHAAERLPRAEQSEANLHVPPLAQMNQSDRLDVLAHQVQDLMTVVRGLQEHCFAPTPQPPPPHEGGHGANQSRRGGTPPEASHHSPPEPHRREASKRRRSLSHHSDRSHRRPGEKEPRRVYSLHRRSSPASSSDSSKDDTNRRTTRRAEQRLDEYHQRLEELSRRIANPHGTDYDHRPPLSRRIMEEPVPPRFRLPQLDPYDGTTDPLDHLESYKVLMQVQGATDSLLCVAFPATLRKAARAWYSRLPPRSINSF